MTQDSPRRYYVFYFEEVLEGEYALARALERGVPHRLQKYYSTAYAGAISLGRGWGRIYVPEAEVERFMDATDNQLAPEPELYVEGVGESSAPPNLSGKFRRFWQRLGGH